MSLGIKIKILIKYYCSEMNYKVCVYFRNSFILHEFVTVFRNHVNNPSECALWLLELIGQIQSKVAERCDEKELLYFFDLLILTITEFSGHSTFITDENLNYCDVRRKELFPQAFHALLCTNDWSVCTTQVRKIEKWKILSKLKYTWLEHECYMHM